jgi:uncharacterized protein (TIGR02453 family)
MMPTTLNLKPVLSFLDQLGQHNERAWFKEHRPDYELARSTFEQYIDGIIDELRASDHLEGLRARDCIARIYRDIRFSKDKSPYKTNMGAMVAPGGWGAGWLGYYISIQPHGQSMVAGGLYSPDPEQLNRFRQAVNLDAADLKEVIGTKEFVDGFGNIEGERLKTAPKGYDREHRDIELLQLKQITAVHRFTDEEVLAGDFADQMVTKCHVLKPFLDYLTQVLQ